MEFRLLSVVTSLLLAASVSYGAPTKTAQQKAKASVKAADSKVTSEDLELEAELEEEFEGEVQDEPTTNVEASPLEPSTSAMMRNQRQQMEIETEEKVVQELESSRMADEQTRRQRVFGDRIQPVGPIQGAAGELKAEADYENNDELESLYYMGLMGGLTDSRAANIDGAGALGFSLGTVIPMLSTPSALHSLGIEAGFVYSLLEGQTRSALGTSNYDVDKYSLSATAKYILKSGWLVPGAGVVMAYTRRQYKVPGEDNFSNALDAGLALSGDVQLNKSVSLGIEYRYMTNLNYEKDRNISNSDVLDQSALANSDVKNLEEVDYQMILLNSKISF